MSEQSTDITEHSDIVVSRPIPRETIRTVETGYLVTCTDSYCDWQGLFPDPDLAATACERHYQHERRTGEYHFGNRSYIVVELLDNETACTLDESSLGLSVEENRYRTRDGGVREAEFPRTTGDVSELVERGDSIDRRDYAESVVYQVSKTRSHGLPTWTVIYLDEDVEMTNATRDDFYWCNELIAQEGEVYTSYGPNPLHQPTFRVIGETEHQADFSEFAGGASP